MSTDRVGTSASGDAQRPAARSRAYAVFADLFTYPDRELCEAARDGTVGRALREVLAAVEPSLASGDFDALAEVGPDDELSVEYTRLYDVGSGGSPPCPLYDGVYGGARMQTMEECVRFYNHFGLTLSDAPRELPDHLVTQLEFLHFLAFREAEAGERGEDAGAFRRAARDFTLRHPGRYLPKLAARLARAEAGAFYRALVERLQALLDHDASWLVAVEGPPPSAAQGR